MKPQPEETAPSTIDPAEAIREQARRVRESRHEIELEATAPPTSEESPESIPVDVEESPRRTRARIRGQRDWDKLKPMLARILLTALGGLAGTGGGVAWQATRPPPSEIELQKLRADLDAEKSARAKDADECKEKIKETRSMDRDSYKDLRELMFEQVNKPLNQRVNSLEAWQADQVREQERDRRHIR